MRHYFSFTAISQVAMEHETGTPLSKHVETNIRLEVSENLDKSRYVTKTGLPTKEGVKPLTAALIQGLIANIHAAHQIGHWDSAQHLRYIIEELEKGFVAVAEITESTMDM